MSPVDSSVSPVDSSVSPVDSSVSPVDSSVSPVDSSVSPSTLVSPVDSSVSPTLEVKSARLKVLYSFPLSSFEVASTHGYDAKRKGLVRDICEQLKQDGANIEMVFPPDFLPLAAVNDYYHQGDVFVCLSQ